VQQVTLRRVEVNQEAARLIKGHGFVVLYESACSIDGITQRKCEIVVDAKTGRPFETKAEAFKAADSLFDAPDFYQADIIGVDVGSGLSHQPMC